MAFACNVCLQCLHAIVVKRCVGVAKQHRGRGWQEHHLHLEVVLRVLQQQGVPTDMDELECMLSNCIVRR